MITLKFGIFSELSKIVGPSDKILTWSDLNYFKSDPMSGAIFSNLGPTKRLKMTGIITYFRLSNLSLFAISDFCQGIIV